ncbi:MAG TPA: hypothetical protein VK453_07850 [Micromonosporaceae bacterium]|nr:hypothetical protein [Micromonosporaceae bacterium]
MAPLDGGLVAVRDSKCPDGSVLAPLARSSPDLLRTGLENGSGRPPVLGNRP